ncbi:phosphate transport system regulatory protein PhoU [candidate division WOR-1 bacterium RIFOXYA12_FULL_43_27]|uniref:Phosphate-specific transport system accessory protein PhoU n=1 Tax=candidate division WOR-1 bacterium RIFOXYC2_FULL_46_14 TaxID=1802587 RepID=A0A1F4U535_UNCSA|nr:MAG: phosphate transport system regulatory protein PhoU [candidate division WOR-1 bacterium RIFOXYA12_FULL_43_27]OGC20679.1 MAG: phosphate transport system regulatory protein PhoU [candidate division WOR-1 bacterium RIFOXYB2_FULL_46_45]OGC31584.1 MAG: phosphate transport system regulatory protein PhoU [candidate division WOR-1 bacterium RIFOXYA2_FULL_46_56]OGC39989.1 MAG: phosphate transport system regulatory protein PhoU [candidate division WOR-1 bacterium RIFOXYC2_FULL_46_14]
MVEQHAAFDEELKDLKDTILRMGILVSGLIRKSVESLKNRDNELAKEVIKQDVEIDRLELEVDEKCINLIALRQPKASDLRFITTAMRIATDLERVGDLAEDIAERSIELADQKPLKPLIDIPRMAKLAEDALSLTIDSFVNRDSGRVEEVWKKEKEIDRLRDLVQDELIEIMERDSKTVTRALPLLLVARHLERIGDHATNIIEDVVFMTEGKVVKHQGALSG